MDRATVYLVNSYHLAIDLAGVDYTRQLSGPELYLLLGSILRRSIAVHGYREFILTAWVVCCKAV